MDKEQPKRDWSWLPAQMPGVARLIAEKRKALGAAWVNECWKRGVVDLQAGWFFAREGALTVGTPFEDADCVNFAAANVTSTQALVLIRQPEGVGDGAHA